MTSDNRTFYMRLAAAMLAVIVVLVVARLLFFTGGGVSSKTNPGQTTSQPKIVIPWDEASKHYGDYCTVEGEIVDSYNSGKACFLNFSPNHKKTFTAVIFGSVFGKFPPTPETFYRGKKVRVKGVIKKYSGRPEVVLESPEQIEVIE